MADEAVIETSFESPPDEVWETLTSPEGVEQWMGEGSTIDEDGDLWMRDFVTGEPKEGRVRTRDPQRLLEFDWWPEDDPSRSSSVSITLEPLPTGTRLVVVERPTVGAVTASAHLSWQWRSATVGVSLHAPSITRPVSRHRVLGAC